MLKKIFGKRSRVKEYQRYRKIGTTLHHKVIEHYVNDSVLEKSARALRLGKNRQLVLDNEDELSVLMEYAIYEVKRQGKNLIQLYQQEVGGENDVEEKLLTAKSSAETGLFRIERTFPDQSNLELRDLISGRKITLTDLNFSLTAQPGTILFLRPIETHEFTMTSGVAFPFDEKHEKELVDRWHKLEKRPPAERYARFFRLFKSKGIATIYME